jgi:uncharacterized protein
MANQNESQEQPQEGQRSEPKRAHNAGNFKNDPERAREAGRKGGQASRGGGRRSE